MGCYMLSEVSYLKMPPVDKFVLMKLADCADDRGNFTCPTLDMLAEECCITGAKARMILSRYVNKGLIIRTGEHTHNSTLRHTYRFNLALIDGWPKVNIPRVG